MAAQKDDVKALQESWGEHLKAIDGRFDRLEQLLGKIGARSKSVDQGPVKSESPEEDRGFERNVEEPLPTRSGGKAQEPAEPGPNGSFTSTGGDSAGSESLANQTNAVYIEHDTAAQKLFRWRSIKALLRQSRELGFSDRTEDYVMDYETNKGVLRIYGRGRQMREVGDSSQSSGGAPSPAQSSSSGPHDEASSTGSPAASPESIWGQGFMPTVIENRPPACEVGGLNPDNTLKLDPKTMNRLYRSYLDNLHIFHPFMEERCLSSLVDQFKQRYNPHDIQSAKASFAVPFAVDHLRESKLTKRKHSDGLYYNNISEPALAPTSVSPKLMLDRSPNTALILLVMALGKICECREDLPGPVPDGSKDTPNPLVHPYSPIGGRTDSPPPSYPMRHSPSSSSHSTVNYPNPSPLSMGRVGGLSSPRSSVGELPSSLRNVDVIPGLAYYAQASDILGNLVGFHDLVNAQCCLLAGLYAGQLANTLESLTWIQAASRICRLLVKK